MNMWEKHPDIWNTESKFLGWVRGGIRRALWEKHPVKLRFIYKNRIRIDNPNPKGKLKEVWGGICSFCNEAFPQNALQVDHKEGGHSLRHIEDLQTFVEGIVLVEEDDLQFACKPCHAIKSYAERCGISMEEARARKDVISISKLPAKDVLTWLQQKGYSGPKPSNAKARRSAIEHVLGVSEIEEE